MAQDHPAVLFFPPLGLLAVIVAAALLEWLLPLGLMPPPGTGWSTTVGVVLIALAVGLALWGVLSFRAAGTNVNPRQPSLQVVETGPYRFTRNPMYLGMVILILGLGFAASLDWALLLAPVFWAALHFGVVLREEAYLSGKFGEPYRAFLGRTRRWL